jgi:hypothetical protein
MIKTTEIVERIHPSAAEYIQNTDLSLVDFDEVMRTGDGDHPLRLLRKLGLLVLDASDNLIKPLRWSTQGKTVRKLLRRQSVGNARSE